jgi:hypothetical protein
MTDSKYDIVKRQLEIFLAKSESERFRIGVELNDFGRKILERSIQKGNPGISGDDLSIEVFKRCYSAFYTPEELDRIILSMREYRNGQHIYKIGK